MNFFKSLYLNSLFFWIISALAFTATLGYFYPFFYGLAKIACLLFFMLIAFDIALLYRIKKGISIQRICPEKLSNGDQNHFQIEIDNLYNFKIKIEVIDELPIQFQKRDFFFQFFLNAGEHKSFDYTVRPTQRGDYEWGNVNVYTSSFLQIIKRRYQSEETASLPCYPSFMQMRKYELMAISNRLTEYGVKKIRQIGHQMEFDQIREYVKGDDYRTINWKATARRSQVMVNQFQDEKSQAIYSIIDCGRNMKMPFNGLSLQDYAINSSLVLSNTAVLKHDKAGLLCFDKKVKKHLPATGRRTQVKKIMEVLYNEKTSFPESDFERLYANVKHHIKSRSLLMLYTNFESLDSMRRNLPYLQQLSKNHLLLVIFFTNTEIEEVSKKECNSLEDIYIKTIAEKHLFDKKLIAKELQKYGIQSILTDPKKLTVNTLNKYLELKARGLI